MLSGMQNTGLRRPRILLIETNPTFNGYLHLALDQEGYEIKALAHEEAALRFQPHSFLPDVILLDSTDSVSISADILGDRHLSVSRVPVVVLTSHDSVGSWLASCQAGVDHYFTKPVHLESFMARVNELLPPPLRRSPDPGSVVAVGSLSLHEASGRVFRDGNPLEIEPTAFDVLRCLMRHAPQQLSSKQILEAVWNFDFGGSASVVERYISYLRGKIDAGRAPMIHTVPGAGYVIKPVD